MRSCSKFHRHRRALVAASFAAALGIFWAGAAPAGEPDAKSYWNIEDVRPGMKGVGKTVMVGTRLDEFQAEVLGVMRGVSPGRDMVLCRLSGCNLEHAGIIQGMSGSPVYIEGKLLGAIAFGWEFAKDPIAGVTPFSQMVEYVRSNDRRIAAESRGAKDRGNGGGSGNGNGAAPPVHAAYGPVSLRIQGLAGDVNATDGPGPAAGADRAWGDNAPVAVAGGAGAGMVPIVTPLAASGFSSRALDLLGRRLRPLGLAPMAGGAAPERIVRAEGNRPLAPGSPLSIGLVLGDFDLSGIGTVTHVEGDRVYGFGHPMFGLGACDLPMMTGYIHTVYPRASVSMKLGSPLKVVGTIDTDVSTSVAGRIGATPDLMPMSVRVKNGPYADCHTYRVRIVREPTLLPSLIMAVLTNAVDTEGNLPEELTARFSANVRLKGREPFAISDTFSGPRYTGAMGASALFSPVASLVNILLRNTMGPVRIESIDCDLQIEPGRKVAAIESVRLLSDAVEPGQELRAQVVLKPFKGAREVVTVAMPVPADFPEGQHEAVFCDAPNSMHRRFRNDPSLLEPRDIDGVARSLRAQVELKRTAIYCHVPSPRRGVSIQGQALPDLPGSVRAVFASKREVPIVPIQSDLIAAVPSPYVIEGSRTLRFTVAKDTGLSVSLSQ